MNKDRMSVLSAMMEQGVIPVFYHPDVEVFTRNVDSGLNAHKFILPGLGDFGDRLYGTE